MQRHSVAIWQAIGRLVGREIIKEAEEGGASEDDFLEMNVEKMAKHVVQETFTPIMPLRTIQEAMQFTSWQMSLSSSQEKDVYRMMCELSCAQVVFLFITLCI